MKLKFDDQLPQFMTVETIKNFSLKELKKLAELQITKLAVETFWLNIFQTCVDLPRVIESVDVQYNHTYQNPYTSFSVHLYQGGTLVPPPNSNLYERHGEGFVIKINLSPELKSEEIEKYKNKIKARLKIGSIGQGLKMLKDRTNDNPFLMSLDKWKNSPILINSSIDLDYLLISILPPQMGEQRQVCVEKDKITKALSELPLSSSPLKALDAAPSPNLSPKFSSRPKNKI